MQDDLVLVVLSNGTYYTTSYDLSNRYQGEILRIEKFDPAKVYSAIYYDGSVKMFYIKRFSFEPYNNVNPASFIAEESGSRFVAITDDMFPQAQVTFKGKSKDKDPEKIDVEEFVEKYGLKAKGRRLTAKDIGKVEFIEPLEKEIPEPEPEPEEEPDTPVEESEPAAETEPANEPEPEQEIPHVVKDPYDLTLF